jgi:hypothetical protein
MTFLSLLPSLLNVALIGLVNLYYGSDYFCTIDLVSTLDFFYLNSYACISSKVLIFSLEAFLVVLVAVVIVSLFSLWLLSVVVELVTTPLAKTPLLDEDTSLLLLS